ncbi:MAG TPA: response regulator [Spirochaetota bacterium]|nr:response regulator [Spirochaetota bacterium]
MESKKAIVCVDDEAIIVLSLKQEIQSRLGDRFICESAMSAEEAFQVIDELSENDIPVALVISDWLMPGVKGDEFLIKLKATHPEVRSIMITGYASDEAIERTLRDAGVSAVLRKPWTTEELIAKVLACSDESKESRT